MIGQSIFDTLKNTVIGISNSLPKANNPLQGAANLVEMGANKIVGNNKQSTNVWSILSGRYDNIPQAVTGLSETMTKEQVKTNTFATIANKKLFGQTQPITGRTVSDNDFSTRILKILAPESIEDITAREVAKGGSPESISTRIGQGSVKGALGWITGEGEMKPVKKGLDIVGKDIFSAEKYVQEKVAAEEAARKTNLGLVDKTKKFTQGIKTKFVDSTSPIKDIFNSFVKNTEDYVPTKDIIHDISNVKRSSKQADMFRKTNGFEDVIKNVPDLNTFDQYLKAKHSNELIFNGIETGRDPNKDLKLIKALSPEYEQYAQKIYDYNHKLLDVAVDGKLITKDTADYLKEKYPNYVNFARIFDDIEQEAMQHGGSGRGVASLSKQSIVQKIEGSSREIENTLVNISNQTNKTFFQAAKNLAAHTLIDYKDISGNPFELKALRTSEDVLRRKDIWAELAELKPQKSKAEKLIKTRSKWVRQLQSELDKLNKQGINEYLKRGEEKGITQKRVVMDVKPTYGKATFKGDEEEFTDIVQTGITHNVKEVKLTAKETKEALKAFIEETPEKIKAIKNKIANREPKLAAMLDDIADIRKELDSVNEKRVELYDEARLIADAESRGKATVSRIKDGVKEIYETTPEIAQAAKSMGVQQLSPMLKILSIPTRIARASITGVSIPFTAANIIRDNLGAFINSKESVRSSVVNPRVFLKSLYDVAGHGDEYQKMVMSGASGTAFDLSREQVAKGIKQTRAERDIASNIKYKVTHPDALFRAVEDTLARGEELTRTMQYRGSMEASIKKGMSETEARALAARAYNENSVDFLNSGEWMTTLNSMILFLNPAIQGTRTLLGALKERPVQTSAKIALTVYTPLAVSTAWNLSSPERKACYDDIPEYEKKDNFIIVPPNPVKDKDGKWNVISIPIPQEVATMSDVMRKSVEQMHGKDPVTTNDLFYALTGTVLPINPVTNENGNLQVDANGLASSFTPQIMKPTIEAYANKNFYTGNPIVPESLSKLSPELQVKDNTSGTVRKVADTLKVSPIMLENWIKETGGTSSQYAINAVDRVLAGLDIIPEDQIGGKSISTAIMDRFSRTNGGALEDKDNKEMQDILQKQDDKNFLKKQEAEILNNELKKLPPEQANAKVAEIKSEDPEIFKKLKSVVEAEKKNLDYGDRLMLNLQVTDGTRAKFIHAKLKTMGTNEEKNAYIKELSDKGIISKQVFAQLKDLKNRGQ